MLTAQQIKEQAQGKWFGIYNQLGIDVGNNGKHTSCPCCGGKDRFRVDKDGSGYICSVCGAGDALSLIRKRLALPFPEVLEKVASMVGCVEVESYKPEKQKNPTVALRKLYQTSKPIQETCGAMNYLKARGIHTVPHDIRYCASCYHSETKTYIPAMLAVFCNKDGKPITLHRTYLNGTKKAEIESPKKIMPSLEPLAGGAVRLFSCGDHLGIAEGIETALSCLELTEIPTWAALSTALMESFVPPEGVKKLTIFADNDRNFAGQKAAYALAHKMVNKPYELDVEVFVPAKTGDYNDELMELIWSPK
jgi:putative DNA primase/helicase